MFNIYKSVTVWCLIFFSIPSIAEGIIDIKPYVSTSIDYDDNVFRFSSPEQAKAAFGSSTTSDTVKRVDLGIDINLRLSRQLLTLSSNINESRYNRFKILDNTGKSNRLSWSWRLGSDVYGELTASKNEAIAGFNEIKQPVNNLRTSSHQIANINWNLHPDWTLSTSYEKAKTGNNLSDFKALDREDDIYESGIRYLNQRGTQVGLSYRVADSNFPSRTGFTQLFFGDESTQKEIIANLAWLPTSKTRISARISQVSLSHPGLSIRDFNGISQLWNIPSASSLRAHRNARISGTWKSEGASVPMSARYPCHSGSRTSSYRVTSTVRSWNRNVMLSLGAQLRFAMACASSRSRFAPTTSGSRYTTPKSVRTGTSTRPPRPS